MFVAGNFNNDLLKIDNHAATQNFFGKFASFHLLPSIYKPTPITSTIATIIDNIFTNCLHNCVQSSTIFSEISDHLPVDLLVDLVIRPSGKHKFVLKCRFTEEATMQFNSLIITSTDWKDVINSCEKAAIKMILKRHIITLFASTQGYMINILLLKEYIVALTITPKKPWITKALVKSCNKKSLICKKMHL